MLRLLVVEDEKMFRDYLIGLLNWDAMDMQIVGACRHGAEAVEFLSEKEADIALVDISMPIMNGIAFSEIAREKWPKLKLIFLTGHNEFEYALSALRLGVSDYLLKPFNEEELLLILHRVREQIAGEMQQKSRLDRQRREDIVRYMNELTSDGYIWNEEQYQEFLAELHGEETVEYYRLAVMEEDYFDEQWEGAAQNNLWRTAVLNMLEESLKEMSHLCFCDTNGKIVILLMYATEKECREYTFEEITRICRLVQNKLKFSVTCAVSDGFAELRKSGEMYHQAKSCLDRKLELGHGLILYTKDLSTVAKEYMYPNIPSERIRESFLDGNLDLLSQIIKELGKEMEKERVTKDILYLVYSQLISVCLSVITERGEDITAIYGEEFHPFSKQKQFYRQEEWMGYVLNLYERAIHYFSNTSYSRTKTLAMEAKNYIKDNYSDTELSVENVAGHLYINSSYLRAAFKKEYAITVSNYIFKTRMEMAHKLIPKGCYKLTEIAGMVGIGDGAYFSKCFKKQYGLTPSEYANLNHEIKGNEQ